MKYATLYQLREYLGIGATETSDDNRLITFLDQSVGMIDVYKGRRFDVRYETRLLDCPVNEVFQFGQYSSQWTGYAPLIQPPKTLLRFDDDLLELIALVNGDGTTITTDYYLKPANTYPKIGVQLVNGATWVPDDDGNYTQVISVSGYWGCHRDYPVSFEDSLDTVQDNPLSSSGSTMTVLDADGIALDGSAQRFQAGQMLKIGTEFVSVVSVDNTHNTLGIKRGYNGTTAAAHAQGTTIYIYRPMVNIQAACIRLSAWRYRQKDADVFDKTAILGSGVKIIPSAMPEDVKALLGAPKVSIR